MHACRQPFIEDRTGLKCWRNRAKNGSWRNFYTTDDIATRKIMIQVIAGNVLRCVSVTDVTGEKVTTVTCERMNNIPRYNRWHCNNEKYDSGNCVINWSVLWCWGSRDGCKGEMQYKGTRSDKQSRFLSPLQRRPRTPVDRAYPLLLEHPVIMTDKSNTCVIMHVSRHPPLREMSAVRWTIGRDCVKYDSGNRVINWSVLWCWGSRDGCKGENYLLLNVCLMQYKGTRSGKQSRFLSPLQRRPRTPVDDHGHILCSWNIL